MVCGNITGNVSDPITIIFYATESTQMGTLHPMDNQVTNSSDITQIVGVHSSATNTVYIISFTSLATALIVGAVLSITVVAIILLKRNQVKTLAVLIHSNREEGTTHDEPMSENVIGPLPSVSTINTQDNVAYGHKRTSTRAKGAMHNEPMYEDVTGPLPLISVINTQDNVAYGHTKTSTPKDSPNRWI